MCFYTDGYRHDIYIQGDTPGFILEKVIYECIDMPCENYTIKRNEVKRYWARVFIQEPTLFQMNEVVDDCLVTFEKFQKQYIIIPSLSLHPLLIEEKPCNTFQSTPGFFNP